MRFSLILCIEAALAVATPSFFSKSPIEAQGSLATEDCQIRCPTSTDPAQVVLPALTQFKNASGHWENTIECWQVDTISTSLPGIDNAFRIDWEGGFDAAYQYIFYGQSFMPAHPAPEPSLILMSAGIGKHLHMSLRLKQVLTTACRRFKSPLWPLPSRRCRRHLLQCWHRR